MFHIQFEKFHQKIDGKFDRKFQGGEFEKGHHWRTSLMVIETKSIQFSKYEILTLGDFDVCCCLSTTAHRVICHHLKSKYHSALEKSIDQKNPLDSN